MSNAATTGLLVSLLAMSITTACATSETPSTRTPTVDAVSVMSAPTRPERIGDLVKVEIDADGELYIREDHQIGGFDAVHFPLARIRYKTGSPTLSEWP